MLIDLLNLRRRLEVGAELARSSSPDWAYTGGAVKGSSGRLSSVGAGAVGHAPLLSSAEVIVGEIKRHKRDFLIALVVFLMLTAGGVFALYWWLGRNRPPNRASGPAAKIVPFTSFPGAEVDPSFSPDGRQIAFAWNGPGGDNYDVYVKLLDAGAPLKLTSHPGQDRSPCWSPDGRHIAFIRTTRNENSIALVPALGGPERVLHSGTAPGAPSLGNSLSWWPDGKSLAFKERVSPLAPFGIYLLSVESFERQRLTSPPAGTRGDRTPPSPRTATRWPSPVGAATTRMTSISYPSRAANPSV
jgi:hypothetical protein